MLADPFNSLLWHAASVSRACSDEIANHASPSFFKPLSGLYKGYIYLINFIPNYSFVVSDNSGQFQYKVVIFPEIQIEPVLNRLPPPEITTIPKAITQYKELFQDLTLMAKSQDYDHVNLYIDIDLSERSLQSLNLFNALGLEKLISLNQLSVDLKLILNPVTPSSVALREKSRMFLSYIDSRFLDIQIQLTNALIYEIDTVEAKLRQ